MGLDAINIEYEFLGNGISYKCCFGLAVAGTSSAESSPASDLAISGDTEPGPLLNQGMIGIEE